MSINWLEFWYMAAREEFGIRGDSVLEVQDQCIGRQGRCLFKRASVGARHVKNTSAGSNGHCLLSEMKNICDHNEEACRFRDPWIVLGAV